MKCLWTRISILILVFSAVLSFTGLCEKPQEKPTEEIWEDNFGFRGELPDRHGMGRGPEMIERMLDRIAEKDPEAAERLKKLHEEDPEGFRAEIRKYLQKYGRRAGGGRSGKHRPHKMKQKYDEYIEWLKENYPNDANELEQIKEGNPQLYRQKVMHSYRKHQHIMRASKDNPELAEVLKENEELKDKRDEMLKKLRTSDDKEQEALKDELRGVLSKRFDLIIKRKQIQHERLLKRLERLKEHIEKSEAEVDKWQSSKDEKVNDRLEELLEDTEKFHWD